LQTGDAVAELLTRSVRAGDLIFAQGDAADVAYVVESGEVEIRIRADGVARRIALVGPGDLLGEMAVVDDSPRSATAIARLDTRRDAAGLAQDPAAQWHDQATIPASPANTGALERIKLENELKASINSGEMRLFVQPIVDMHSHQIAGFESLVRWQHPVCGMVRPDVFIGIAEDCGLIVPLGRWILREACGIALRFEREANRAGLQGRQGFISVNVSAGQFHDPDFLPALAGILGETGMAPSRLKLEITESVLTDSAAAKRWIEGCKALGVRVALDDFGTGYSSLSYLHEFEIDTLKIDQSFVRRILDDQRSEKIVAAIIQLSQSLGLEIIAEGIETQVIFDRLAAMGCQYAQGYLIARPSPADAYFDAA
jgi:EAL domain-containing protein (putative c-di-GMP-specific phosphodiesterase class I)